MSLSIILLISALVYGLPIYFWVQSRKEKGIAQIEEKRIEQLAYDLSLPEKQRRAEMIKYFIDQGYLIDQQGEGFIRITKPKAKFSIVLFLFLMFCFGIGLIYLLMWATSKPQTKQFTLITD